MIGNGIERNEGNRGDREGANRRRERNGKELVQVRKGSVFIAGKYTEIDHTCPNRQKGIRLVGKRPHKNTTDTAMGIEVRAGPQALVVSSRLLPDPAWERDGKNGRPGGVDVTPPRRGDWGVAKSHCRDW